MRNFLRESERPLAWLAVIAAIGAIVIMGFVHNPTLRTGDTRSMQREHYARFMEGMWTLYFHSLRYDPIMDKSYPKDDLQEWINEDISGLFNAYYMLEPYLRKKSREEAEIRIVNFIAFCHEVYDQAGGETFREMQDTYYHMFREHMLFFEQLFHHDVL